MPEAIYLGFDFGFKRIGIAVGQKMTYSARPLTTLQAKLGIPNWSILQTIIHNWQPQALIVGLPVCIDGSWQYITKAVHCFVANLRQKFILPVFLVDERLSTKEARARLFEIGGCRKIAQTAIDEIAACIILEQWLRDAGNNKI